MPVPRTIFFRQTVPQFSIDISGVNTEYSSFFGATSSAPTIVSAGNDTAYFAYSARGENFSFGLNTFNTYKIAVGTLNYVGQIEWIALLNELQSTGNDGQPAMVIGAANELYIAYVTNGAVPGRINMLNKPVFCGPQFCQNPGPTDIVLARVDIINNQPVVRWVIQDAVLNSCNLQNKPVLSIDTTKQVVYITYQVAGSTQCNPAIGIARGETVVTAISTDGVLLWQETGNALNTPFYNEYSAVASDRDGNTFVAIVTPGNLITPSAPVVSNVSNVFLVRFESVFSPSGAYVSRSRPWTVQIPFSSGGLVGQPSIQCDDQCNIYIAFSTSGVVTSQTRTNPYYDTWIAKYDINGNLLWQRYITPVQDGEEAYYYTIDPVLDFNSRNELFLSANYIRVVGGPNNVEDVLMMGFNISTGDTEWVYFENSVRKTKNEPILLLNNTGTAIRIGRTSLATFFQNNYVTFVTNWPMPGQNKFATQNAMAIAVVSASPFFGELTPWEYLTQEVAISDTHGIHFRQTEAKVFITNVSQPYLNIPRIVTVNTVPPGLPLVVYYNKTQTPPVESGMYGVFALVTDSNYKGYAFAQLQIAQNTLIVIALNASRLYGAPDPVFVIPEPTGFIPGENSSNAAGYVAPFGFTNTTSNTDIGVYKIEITGGQARDYFFDYSTSTGEMTILPVMLFVSPFPQTRMYGYPNPFFTMNVVGLRNGETPATAKDYVSPVGSSSTNNFTIPGTYPIAISGGSANNYLFTLSPGVLTIIKALLTVTVPFSTREYGDPDPIIEPNTPTGFVNGDTPATADGYIAPFAITNSSSNSIVGTYAIFGTGGAATFYNFSYILSPFIITRAPLILSVSTGTRYYGEENPTFDFEITGFKLGETSATAAGYVAPTTVANANISSPAGVYSVIASGGSADNYSFNVTGGVLEVVKAPISTFIGGAVREYGEPNPTTFEISVDLNDFKFGQTPETAEGYIAPSGFVSTSVDETSDVGIYPLLLAGGFADNYSFNFFNSTLEIMQAPLFIEFDPQTREYGNPDPVFTYTPIGFKNGETEASEFAIGKYFYPSTFTTATSNDPIINRYIIFGSDGFATNYYFNYIGAELTITRALIDFTADNKVRFYGDPNPELTYSPYNLRAGENISTILPAGWIAPSITTTANNLCNIGTYPITLTGGSADNYSFTTTGGILTIQQSILFVSAETQIMYYGDTPSTGAALTVLYGGGTSNFKNGENATTNLPAGWVPSAAFTSNLSELSDAGNYDIYINPGSADNYQIVDAPGAYKVFPRNMELSLNTIEKTYGTAITLGYVGTDGFVLNPPLGTQTSNAGLVNGQSISSVKLFSVPPLNGAPASAPVFDYPITVNYTDTDILGEPPSGPAKFKLVNYSTFTINPGILRVTPKDMTINASTIVKVANLSTVLALGPGRTEFTAEGLVLGQTVDTVTLSAPGNIGGFNGTESNAPAGNYPLVASAPVGSSGFIEGNYSIAYNAGEIQVIEEE